MHGSDPASYLLLAKVSATPLSSALRTRRGGSTTNCQVRQNSNMILQTMQSLPSGLLAVDLIIDLSFPYFYIAVFQTLLFGAGADLEN